MTEPCGLVIATGFYAERWRKSECLVGSNSNTFSDLEAHAFKAETSEAIHA
jgi:hypothetical protein